MKEYQNRLQDYQARMSELQKICDELQDAACGQLSSDEVIRQTRQERDNARDRWGVFFSLLKTLLGTNECIIASVPCACLYVCVC